MSSPGNREQAFIGFLEGLVEREDLGALAALRRGLGRRPGEVPEMYPYVVPFLPDEEWRQDAYFLIASLFALHQGSWRADGSERDATNLGASFARLSAMRESSSIERRFVALLSCDWEDLPEHLRSAVSLLKSEEVPIDWLRLLRDMQRWDRDERPVQRAWARAYWGDRASELAASATGGSERE